MTNPIKETTYGAVEGFRNEGCELYFGIPYAKPPVGELAFQHPLPPEPWSGVLKADRGSSNAIQAHGLFGVGNNSKNCLYLNVFVPENAGTKLPVMVWIHGGAFAQSGTGATVPGTAHLNYDFTRFARETGCIVVSFNYRLNLYGFLNLHVWDSSFGQNNGLYDQIQALRFVRENIAAFGGDPENITLFGQSAGGASVLALMTMDETEGLFHKAIVQSACIEHFFTEEESRLRSLAYLRAADIESAEELLSLSAQRVEEANAKLSTMTLSIGDVRCPFSPIIDGVTLREEPKLAVKRNKRPLLIGNVTQEANLFLGMIPDESLPPVVRMVRTALESNEESCQKVSDALTNYMFVRPELEIIRDYAGPVFHYVYEYVLPGSTMGCFHACELPTLLGKSFETLKYSEDPESERVGTEMRRLWAQFAKEGRVDWKPGEAGMRMVEERK